VPALIACDKSGVQLGYEPCVTRDAHCDGFGNPSTGTDDKVSWEMTASHFVKQRCPSKRYPRGRMSRSHFPAMEFSCWKFPIAMFINLEPRETMGILVCLGHLESGPVPFGQIIRECAFRRRPHLQPPFLAPFGNGPTTTTFEANGKTTTTGSVPLKVEQL
jgi:hypothetical protein